MLRFATTDDIPFLVSFGRKFHALSPLSDVPFNETKVEQTAIDLLQGPKERGIILVWEEDNSPVGCLVGIVSEPYFSTESIASELVFWIEPEYRKLSTVNRLIEAYEYWANRVGAKITCLSCFNSLKGDTLVRMYERKGYDFCEQTFKKVNN